MNTIFDLRNKTALVTGGGSGIGRAIAELFAAHGAHVNILELNEAAAEACVNAIREKGGKAQAVKCNVSNHSEVKQVVDTLFQQQGKLDILINNAGIAHVGTLESTSEADFDRIFQVNVKGAYNMMHAVISHMKQQGGGVILNMASIASSLGLPDRFAYSMSKGAVLTMTMSVARDYVKHNIRCNCISPARVHTPFVDGFLKANYPGHEEEMFQKLSATQPVGRMGKPEEIATLALYLCSDQASFITGSDYPIDGGFIRLNT